MLASFAALHGLAHVAQTSDVLAEAADGHGRFLTWRARAGPKPLRVNGAVRSACVLRWDKGRHGRHAYVPCSRGPRRAALRRPRHPQPPDRRLVVRHAPPAPFFEAEILAAEPFAPSSHNTRPRVFRIEDDQLGVADERLFAARRTCRKDFAADTRRRSVR